MWRAMQSEPLLFYLDSSSTSPMVVPPPRCRGVQKFSKLPNLKSIHPFSVRMTTEDGSRLPIISPQSLMELFEKYEGLKSVAVNWRTQQQKTEGIKFWWVEFHTRESLERFVLDIDGSAVNNTRLCVVVECKWISRSHKREDADCSR